MEVPFTRGDTGTELGEDLGSGRHKEVQVVFIGGQAELAVPASLDQAAKACMKVTVEYSDLEGTGP